MSSTATKHIQGLPQVEGSSAEVPMQGFKQKLLSFLASASPSNWEHVVANKSIDSVTMPKWVAIAILGTVLAFGAQQWWSRQAEHDTLVEIRTELRLAKEHQAEKDRTINGKLNDLDAWKDVMNGNMKEIKGMLTQQQRDAVGRPNGHNNQ